MPNTDDLGLEKAGVETDHSGFIRVDDELRTNVSGIWAYVTRSLEIALGYSEAMTFVGPEYQVLLAVFSLAAITDR